MSPKNGKSLKIIWTAFAKERLKEISLYYSQVAGPIVSGKIRNRIFHATRHLAEHPELGQTEHLLKGQEHDFRYCIAGNYKIIYTSVKEGILVIDVFDTRQDPGKMNKSTGK